MRMGQGVRTGLGHGGITCVLQTQFSSFLLFSKEPAGRPVPSVHQKFCPPNSKLFHWIDLKLYI